MGRRLRAVAFVLATAVHLSHSGCTRSSHRPELPPPPSEDLRAGLGKVSVRAVEEPLEGYFEPPLVGACSSSGFYSLNGAIIGFVVGAKLWSEVINTSTGNGAGIFIFFVFLFCAVFALLLMPVGAFVGGLYGLCAGPSGEEVERGMATLQSAARDTRLASSVAEQIRRATGLGADEGHDSVLEIGPVVAALSGPWRDDPPLTLSGALPARLVQRRRVVWTGLFSFGGSRAPFDHWVRDGGGALRSEFDKSVAPLAQRIAFEAFTLYLLPKDRMLAEPDR